MAKSKEDKRKNGKLSLKPLKFDEAVQDLLKVPPEPQKESNTESQRDVTDDHTK